jgi:hypothetical protein
MYQLPARKIKFPDYLNLAAAPLYFASASSATVPVSVMASTALTVDVARRSLLEEGYFDLHDSTVGDRVLEMEKHGFPYLTEYGMDFCKQFAFDEVSGTMIFYATV